MAVLRGLAVKPEISGLTYSATSGRTVDRYRGTGPRNEGRRHRAGGFLDGFRLWGRIAASRYFSYVRIYYIS